MSRITCSKCLTSCVGCAGRCKCGMRDNQAKQANEIFALYPNFLQDKELSDRVVEYVKKGIRNEDIIKSIETGEEPEVNESISITSKYCEYPVGSGGLGAWVSCTKCGLERREGRGKICKGVPL